MLMRKKRKYSLFLVFVLFLTMAFYIPAENTSGEEEEVYCINTSCKTEESFIVNETAANKAYSLLLDYFREEEKEETGMGYMVSGVSDAGFPGYYSGAYINQNGNLVIMLNSSLTPEERQNIQIKLEHITETSDLYFRNAEVPYSDLVNVMNALNTFIASGEYLEQNRYHIYGFGIDDSRNLVQIESDISSNKTRKQLLESVGIEEKLVSFTMTDEKAVEDTVVYPGESIHTNSTFSAGFRARYQVQGNFINGFVTCAHGFTTSSYAVPVYNSSSANIGNLDINKYAYGGSVDAAFIAINSGYSVTNQIKGTSDYTTASYTTLAQGSIVHKRGQSTGSTTGIVQNSSYTSPGDSTTPTLTDTVKASYNRAAGDSGGITYSGSGNTSIPAGIHIRGTSDYGVYCKAYNIITSLGVSIY